MDEAKAPERLKIRLIYKNKLHVFITLPCPVPDLFTFALIKSSSVPVTFKRLFAVIRGQTEKIEVIEVIYVERPLETKPHA